MEIVGAQAVLLPVNLTMAWIYWSYPDRTARHGRGADWLALALAASAWILAGFAATQFDPGHARIWPTVVGATAGFLSFSVVLLGFWVGRFGIPR